MRVDVDVVLNMVQWSALTRILRELVNNTISHAKASKVRIWRGDGSTEQYDCRRIVDSPEAGPEVLPGDVVEVKREVCAQNPPAETTGAKQEWTPCARPANGAKRGERTLRSTVAQKSEWQSFPKSGNVPV